MDAASKQADANGHLLQAVDRAISDLRRGSLVAIHTASGRTLLTQAAETASSGSLAELRDLAKSDPVVLLSAQRSVALGLDPGVWARSLSGIAALSVERLVSEVVIDLADPTRAPRSLPEMAPASVADLDGLDAAAIDLAKLARLLPAAVVADLGRLEDPAIWAKDRNLLTVTASDIAGYRFAAAQSLRVIAEARVPLINAEATKVLAFRPSDGGIEHLALVIGQPRAQDSVLTRVHSECFTGDLLGSLRCDCGDQLRGAIEAIGSAGSGVLLYLAQEGRGIGLANKLRAYALQDRGADTLEANEQLGFDADERVYLPAAEMLRQLGFRRVRLLTNNPEKVAALQRCGIAVEERVPHSFPSNRHNEPYLATKAKRFGHLF